MKKLLIILASLVLATFIIKGIMAIAILNNTQKQVNSIMNNINYRATIEEFNNCTRLEY